MFRLSQRLCGTTILDSARIISNPQLSSIYSLKTQSSPKVSHAPAKTDDGSAQKWTTIYNHRSIASIAIVSNLKVYQGIGTTVAAIVMGIAELNGHVIPGTTLGTTGMGIGGAIGICLYSAFFANTIGFVYVCPKIENIRLAYIDFWGKRKHVELPIRDLILPEHREKLVLYWPIKTASSKDTYNLFYKSGEIFEPDVFSHIFEQQIKEKAKTEEKKED